MKTALLAGETIQATPEAPKTAVCPRCGKPVELKFLTRDSQRIWYYRHCSEGPPRRPTKTEQVNGDPLKIIASTAVERTIEAARRGDLNALLSLAFSPFVHQVLTLIDLSPEEVLHVVAPIEIGPTFAVVFNVDLQTASRMASRTPVFDLSPELGEHRNKLEGRSCYVPLDRISPWQARMIQRVLKRTERACLIGGQDDECEWRDILRAPHLGESDRDSTEAV